MELTTLATVADLENKGVWLDFEDARFLIAATGRPAYSRAMQRHARPVARKLANNIELQETVAMETMADAVLLDFEGLTSGGKPLDGKNREDRLAVLKIRTIREFIATEAANIANFQAKEDAAEVDALKSGA